jgi:hypothetical protein
VLIDVQDEIDKLPQIFHAWQAASGVVTMRWKAAECTKCDLFCDRSIRMKGPGLRIDLDVRRVWRCAKCGKTVRTPVQVVAQRCACSDAPWMTLQPPVKREPFRPPVREPLPEIDAAPEHPVPATFAADVPIGEPSAAALPAAEPAPDGFPAESSLSVATITPSATEPPAAPPEAAVAEPPASAPSGTEPAPVHSPPDDFGAGLGDIVPEPPA